MQKIETHKVFQLGNTPVTIFCMIGPEADETYRSFLYAKDYPAGTIVKITYPEIKSEPEVVYPGGAYWNDDGCLINKTGQMIGHTSPDGGTAMYTDSSGCLYTRTASAGFENQDEAKGWVVNQLAKHRHYGFRFKGEG